MSRKLQYRAIELETRASDDGLIPAVISTETPVERFFGMEVLDHQAGSVDLSRAERGLPLLFNHNPSEVIGRMINVRLDGRKLRGELRQGESTRAAEIFRDITAGNIDGVSIGYRTRGKPVREPNNVFRFTDWQLHEASAVSIAADPAAGTFRSQSPMNDEDEIGTEAEPEKSESKPATGGVSLELHAIERTRSEESQRAGDIRKIAKLFSYVPEMSDLADDCIEQGATVERFREEADKAIRQYTTSIGTTKARSHLDLEPKQEQSYSILRALSAMYAKRIDPHWGDPRKLAPFELECSRHLEDVFNREAKGMFVPWDLRWPMQQQRTEAGLIVRTPPMGVGTAATVAAGLKGTMHMAENFIEALRPSTVAIQAGATMLPGLVSDIQIPKQTGLSTFTWLAEDDSSADTEVAIGLVNLTPKTISGSVPITRKMLKQSTPAVEGIVRSDIVNRAAEAIDLAAYQGLGSSNQPLGVVLTSGVLTQAVATDATPTWAEIVGFESAVNGANALRYGGLAYVTTPALFGALKTISKDAGSGQFINVAGVVNGYPIFTSSQLATSRLIFGAHANMLIGMWGVLDLMMDVATNAAKGRLTIRAFQDVDIALRHAQSFCIGT